jgi:hypothetical protein
MYPIEKMCKVLKVSRSSYYRRFSYGPSNRAIENSLFTNLIKEIFDLSNQTYETGFNTDLHEIAKQITDSHDSNYKQ